MNNSMVSQLGVLGTGGMGGALYAASSSLASIDNEIMSMELKTLSREAKVSADITKIRLNTQEEAASQTQKSTMTQVDEEYVSAGTSLAGCVAGIGFGIKDFSSGTLDDEMTDTKAFQNSLKPSSESIADDQELQQVRNEKTKLLDTYHEKDNDLINRWKSTTDENEIQNIEDESDRLAKNFGADMKKINAREEEIQKRITSRGTSGSLGIQLQANPSAPTEEEQVIDRWTGNDMRVPKVSGFRGHDPEEMALNKRAAELLKADPAKLRSVRNSVDERLSELERQKDSINANKQQSLTMTVNSATGTVSQGAGGYYKTEGAGDTYTAAIDTATAQSIEMAERAFQEGVRGYEQAAEQLRQAAIQVAQGYQQAARG